MEREGGEAVSDKEWWILPCMVLVALACIISNIFGIVKGIDKQQQEAVITGHAEWVADQNGKPQFKWKESK